MEYEKLGYFCDCIENAFQKMVSEVAGLKLIRDESAKPAEGKNYLMIIGVVGINRGQIMVEMNEGLVKRIIEGMNGGLTVDEEELAFSLAEFINMVGGNGINLINRTYSGFNLRLIPPAILTGNNMENTIIKTRTVSRFYTAEQEQARIEIGFEGV